nr:FAD-dependent oxidoreductase [Spiroplasma phoeniceum]
MSKWFRKKGIKIKTNTKVTKLVVENNKVTKIKLSSEEENVTYLALVAIGVTLATNFLKTTDLKMNEFGAILVNNQFETNKY